MVQYLIDFSEIGPFFLVLIPPETDKHPTCSARWMILRDFNVAK